MTVPSMDGEEVRDFAYELANRWGIGKEKEDTGVPVSYTHLVEIQRVEENGVVYFVTDIYVNSIDNLRAGLAKDKFGQGLRESVQSMSQRLNAIVAINRCV